MKVRVLNNFAVGHNHLGKAVFAARSFKPGDIVTEFTGSLVHIHEVPQEIKGESDRFVQVGKDTYMGPSGGVDDLINHSCDPNTGLRFKGANIFLVAIKPIAVGEEITWDYSTTLFENPWQMKCDCRTNLCRTIIRDFSLLPQEIQEKYRLLRVIPPYIEEYINNPDYSVYNKGIEQLKTYEGK